MNNEEIQYQISVLQKQIDPDINTIKILFCLPESAGDIFLATSLLPQLKKLYDPCDIYFGCYKQYHDILNNNPYIYKTIDYLPIMDNQLIMEGAGQWPGLFDISIFVSTLTQRHMNYLNNGKTKSMFEFKV